MHLCGMGICPACQLAHWKQGVGAEKANEWHPGNGTGALAGSRDEMATNTLVQQLLWHHVMIKLVQAHTAIYYVKW